MPLFIWRSTGQGSSAADASKEQERFGIEIPIANSSFVFLPFENAEYPLPNC